VQEAIDALNRPQRFEEPQKVDKQEDRYAKLEKIASLKDKGILTEAEFLSEKEKILSL
jgi:hypothetical protein